jgi:hypothetical protein
MIKNQYNFKIYKFYFNFQLSIEDIEFYIIIIFILIIYYFIFFLIHNYIFYDS